MKSLLNSLLTLLVITLNLYAISTPPVVGVTPTTTQIEPTFTEAVPTITEVAPPIAEIEPPPGFPPEVILPLQTIDHHFTASISKKVEVVQGWNMISIPGYQSVELSTIFSDSDHVSVVYYYDPSSSTYKSYDPASNSNEITSIDPSQGIWVNANKKFTLLFNEINAYSTSNPSGSSTPVSSTTPAKGITIPSALVCEANGGDFTQSLQCMASWYGAKVICSAMNATLLTSSQFRHIYANYEELGFIDETYWSSTMIDADRSVAVAIQPAIKQADTSNRDNFHYVMCLSE